MSDLVKRLRDWEVVYECDEDKPEGSLYLEAAERIAELEAAGKEASAAVVKSINKNGQLRERIAELEAERDKWKRLYYLAKPYAPENVVEALEDDA